MAKSELTFSEALELHRSIYRRFSQIEGRSWGAEGGVIELTKQVGELARLVMVEEGYYFANRPGYDAGPDKIADELTDILGAIIRLADHYGIDLEAAHIDARRREAESLDQLGA